MVHLHLALEPHVGTPMVNRAEAEAGRLYRQAKQQGKPEPFERHLADAYAGLLSGAGIGRSRRPELVVLVSHEVTQRGWTDVRAGELCKVPGIGPISPEVAKRIAADAFLSGVLYDGKDLRQMRRWTRDPLHPGRGASRPGAGAAAGVRRGPLQRFWKPIPQRERPRRAPRRLRSRLDRQPRASLLELPSGQDRAGPQGGQADAARAVRDGGTRAEMRRTNGEEAPDCAT